MAVEAQLTVEEELKRVKARLSWLEAEVEELWRRVGGAEREIEKLWMRLGVEAAR